MQGLLWPGVKATSVSIKLINIRSKISHSTQTSHLFQIHGAVVEKLELDSLRPCFKGFHIYVYVLIVAIDISEQSRSTYALVASIKIRAMVSTVAPM